MFKTPGRRKEGKLRAYYIGVIADGVKTNYRRILVKDKLGNDYRYMSKTELSNLLEDYCPEVAAKTIDKEDGLTSK